MAELGPELHPIAEDLSLFSQALDRGIAEELPYMGLLRGFDVNVIPGESLDDGYTYMRIEPFGGKSLVEYKVAPLQEVPNPLVVISAEENGDIVSTPIIGRMVVSSQALIPVGKRGDLPIKASMIQVDVLEDGAVISMNESTGIQPFFGEFDDTAYGFIRKKTYGQLRLDYIAGWTRQFIEAA